MLPIHRAPRIVGFLLTLTLTSPAPTKIVEPPPVCALRVSQESTGLEELRHTLAPTAGLEEDFDAEVTKGLVVLQVPGKWLEETIRENVLEKIENYESVRPSFAAKHLLENRPLKQLPSLVYKIGEHSRERELHFHFPTREPWVVNLLRGQLRINESGTLQTPFWFESHLPFGLRFSSEGLDYQVSITQVPIEINLLPQQLLQDLTTNLEKLLGPEWRQKILSTTPKGRFFTAEPLLANPETWKLFLKRIRESPNLQEVLRKQAWGHRAGNWKGYTGDISQALIVGLPLVVTGQLRRTLDTKRFWNEASDRNLYFEKFGSGSPEYKPLVLVDSQGNPQAYFDAGFLLVKPNTSFHGREELLEELFLKGARLSQEFDNLLSNSATWPPSSRTPAARMEEPAPVHPFIRQILENVGTPAGSNSEEFDSQSFSSVGLEEPA